MKAVAVGKYHVPWHLPYIMMMVAVFCSDYIIMAYLQNEDQLALLLRSGLVCQTIVYSLIIA